jgi:hypothetical protein
MLFTVATLAFFDGDNTMRYRLMLAILAAVAVALPVGGDEKKEEKKDGWVQLFNGKDLTGWKVYPKGTGNWKVEDGVIIGSGKASHLFTERGDYKNFHFKVEAMINDKGNSGQYFRTKFGPGFPRGYEAQINATHGDKVKTGSLYPDYREKHLQGVKENIILEAPHKPDEWFTQEVICKGPNITILVNGKKTVEFKDPKYDDYKEGHFALQQHDPGSVVKFRKIEVKELPDEKE